MASIVEHRRNGPSARTRDGSRAADLPGQALFAATLAYLYFECFGGVARYVFPMVGLTFLSYIPAGVAILAVLYDWIDRATDRKSAVSIWLCLGAIVATIFMSLLLGRNPLQIGISLYTWLPFLVGLALAQRREIDRVVPHIAVIFVIAALGVLLNKFVQMPWSDATYEVMGKQMSASRNWEQYGVSRLAGFSRASFVAAAEILVGFIAIEYRLRSFPAKIVAYAVGLTAIYFTTSKSPAATMIVLPIVYLILGRFSDTAPAQRRIIAGALLASCLIFVFAGPLLAITYGPQLYPNGVGTGAAYSSLADRILNMWPRAIALIDWANPVHWIVGQGLGSIGSGQIFNDADDVNAGDNILIYLFVMFGMLSFVFGFLLFRGGMTALSEGSRGRRDFLFIFALLGIGAMANIIEGVLTSFLFGLACGRVKTRSSRASRSSRETPAAG